MTSQETAARQGTSTLGTARFGFVPRGLALRALVFAIVAAVVSVAGSWIPSIWGDEATSILSAERPLPSLFRMLGHVDAVHGTYYLLLHFWVDVFGPSAFSVRVPSAIAVGIAAAGVVVLANRLAGNRISIYAGVIFVILPRTTYMGEEARGYAFSAALAVWATVLLVELLTKRASQRSAWILYAVAIAACGYMFLFSLLILPVHLVAVAAYRRDLLRRWLTWTAAGLALALPVLVYGVGEQGQIAFLAKRSAATPDSVLVQQWFGNVAFAIVAWAAIVLAIALAARQYRRSGRRTQLFFVIAGAWLVLPMGILLGINWVHAIYSARYLSFATPAVALVLAWLIGRLRRPTLPIVALVAVVALALPTYVAQRTVYAKNSSDWSVDAAYIGAHAKPGAGILFDESTRPSRRPRLALHAYPSDFTGLKDIALKTPWWQTDGWRDSVYSLDTVADRLDDVPTVWLIEYRNAGTSGDSYDLSTLQSLGYNVVVRHDEYRSVILELTRSN